MEYPKFNKKQLSGKNKLKFHYIFNSAKESIAFDNDEHSLGLSDKQIDLLSYNTATNCLHAIMKEFIHL